MTYSIIGSGHIGSALARQFARKGTDVAIANARGPDSLGALGKELGQHIIPQTLEAALKADMVILATPFSAVPVIARAGGNWTGKIVIDATNAIDFPAFTPTDLGGRPSSEVVAGDDAKANSEVASLAAKFGFAPITLGKLSEGGLLQQFGGPLTIQNLLKLG
jgi:predicted dinucleotide-binding enzyme